MKRSMSVRTHFAHAVPRASSTTSSVGGVPFAMPAFDSSVVAAEVSANSTESVTFVLRGGFHDTASLPQVPQAPNDSYDWARIDSQSRPNG
ncbi:MAG: hypothetical protein ABIT38_09685 [Gemmatimonadaceae bacterium]